MMRYYLTIELKSDATFGRGEGVAGLVDTEIDHDAYGFPFIDGRTLKGLLREEWQNLRFALGERATTWDAEGMFLFGESGATDRGTAEMHIGAATLPPALLAALRRQIQQEQLRPIQVLEALTTIRRQTAMDARTGAPEPGSLRSVRVLLRETPLIAALDFAAAPEPRSLALLAACVLALRRGGTLRNRGRGCMALLLHEAPPDDYRDAAFTRTCFARFAQETCP